MEYDAAGTRPLERSAALGGAAFVVLFVIGNILMFSGTPSGDDPPAKVIAYYSDSGHRDRIGVGWILAGLGVFAFLWFLVALRQSVRRYDGEGLLTALTTVGGTIYATLAFAAIGLDMGVRTMSDDTYRHEVFPGVIHAADDASYIMHATGGAGLAAMILAAAVALTRGGAVRPWVLWVSVVVALAALTSIFFVTMALWGIWILVVSVLLYLQRLPATTAGTPVTRAP